MIVNSDTANKMIKEWQQELNRIENKEYENRTYSYLNGEEQLIPPYDFNEMFAQKESLYNKIIATKHAINCFNTTTMVPGTSYTIDQALVRMAMLSTQKYKLSSMKNMRPTTRRTVGTGVSEFTVINFKMEDIDAAYDTVSQELMLIQQGLNMVNMTETFEIDV